MEKLLIFFSLIVVMMSCNDEDECGLEGEGRQRSIPYPVAAQIVAVISMHFSIALARMKMIYQVSMVFYRLWDENPFVLNPRLQPANSLYFPATPLVRL